MLCPHCQNDLKIADRQGIEIDYCPKCRGVWLDRGELDKILERSVASAAPAPSTYAAPPQGGYGGYEMAPQDRRWRRDDDDDDDDDDRRRYGSGGYGQPGYGRPRRREHWLSDLFDFG
jgi:Zn-finger nucleic acid-binding protein